MNYKKKRWLFIIIAAIGYSAIWTFPYMIETYYIPVQEAFGFTNQQIGMLMTLFGISSAIFYFPGGIVADRFSVKILLCFSFIGTGILGACVILVPPFPVMLAIQLAYGITITLTLWAAVVKFLRMVGDDDEQGKIYGSFFAISGLAGVIMGFAATALYDGMGQTVIAFKALVGFYTACVIIPGIVFALAFNEKEFFKGRFDNATSQKITLAQLKNIFKMPIVWILVAFVYFSFIPKSAMTYFQGYMQEFYALPVALISIVAIIRVQVIRLIVNPLAGIATDKIKSSSKMLGIACAVGIIASVIVLLTPHDPNLLLLIIASLFLFSAMYQVVLSQSFIPISEAKIPVEYTGTITGIVSVLGYSSDIYYYSISGSILDKQGANGYTTIFIICLICSVIAFALTFVLKNSIKKTRAQFEAQNYTNL